MSIDHPRARRAGGFRVLSLDDRDDAVSAASGGTGKGWLAADNRVGPADEAAFRVDFADWLAGLPARKHQIAELLAAGHETGVVAGMLGLSAGRVSQVRLALEASWWAFQGQVEATSP